MIRDEPGRRWTTGFRAAVGSLFAVLIGLGPVAIVGADEEDDRPGVYTEEGPDDRSGEFTAAASAGLFVGAGTSSAQKPGEPLLLSDMADFEDSVSDPSPALSTAVENYFANTESEARVLLTSSEDADALKAGIASVTADVGPALWIVPAIAALSGADYQAVAVELSTAAETSMGLALLDPPDSVVAPLAGSSSPDVAALSGLAGILRSALPAADHVVMYSGPLVGESDGRPQVPAAAVMAAKFIEADKNVGQWKAPAGTSYPLHGYDPLYSIDNPTNATLNTAGVEAIRSMPGYGTVVWGSRTLGEVQGEVGYVSTVRTLDLVNLSIRNGADTFTGSANSAQTWANVDRDVSSFLEGLWQQGAMFGSSSAQAYDVKVGVPDSMTDADVANGEMRIIAEVALVSPGEFFSTEVSVQMTGG